MKTRYFAMMLIAALSLSLTATDRFSTLLVFGDSISDVGAGYQLARSLKVAPIPPEHIYFDHHWGNGPGWGDYVASALKLDQQNYSVGGATLGSENSLQDFAEPLGGIEQIIARYQSANRRIDSGTLTVVEGGYNDVILEIVRSLHIPDHMADLMLARAKARMEELLILGADPLIVWNLFDVTLAPIFGLPPFVDFSPHVKNVIAEFNIKLPLLAVELNAQYGSNAVVIFDAYKAFDQTLTELVVEGIDPTLFTILFEYAIPLSFEPVGPIDFQVAFYDTVHPGTYFWQKFAPKFIAAINDVFDISARSE